MRAWRVSFLERVATCARSGLFFIASEAGLATLLALINDGEPYFGNEVRDGGIGGAEMAQSEAMRENEAAEGGVIFKELCAVRRDVVDRGSGSEGSCDAPGILLASGSRGILEEVTDGVCSSGEREVWFRGDEGGEAKDSGEDDHK